MMRRNGEPNLDLKPRGFIEGNNGKKTDDSIQFTPSIPAVLGFLLGSYQAALLLADNLHCH
jgi:hypothetical protein